MKTKIALLTLLACAQLALAQQVREIVPRPGDRDYDRYTKLVVYYDASGSVEKVDSYLTAELSAKMGYDRQLTVYRDGIEYSFEMFQTGETLERTGLERRIDYVDAKDRLERVELLFSSGRLYSLEGEELKVLKKHTVNRLAHYEGLFRECEPAESTYSIEAPVFMGISDLGAASEVSDVTAEEKSLITRWCGTHRLSDLSASYPRKYRFEEGGRQYWILAGEALEEAFSSGEAALVYYCYIGGYGLDPCNRLGSDPRVGV
jgi:hypothetical protein